MSSMFSLVSQMLYYVTFRTFTKIDADFIRGKTAYAFRTDFDSTRCLVDDGGRQTTLQCDWILYSQSVDFS